jgi:antitoxin component YwqK of YwqJK toxin-antitoxin module
MTSEVDGTEKRRIVDHDGLLVEEAHYLNGLLHGKRTLWSPRGVKIGEADYQGGKLHGHSLLWNEEGQLMVDAYYADDELHGSYVSIWDNAAVKEQGHYKHGARVGIYRWFAQDGKLESEHKYSEE